MDHRTIQFGWASVVGAIGGVFTLILGTWTIAITIMCICMGVDILTGITVAKFFVASPKTESGGYSSREVRKGLMRKGGMCLVVLVAHYVDLLIGTQYIRDAVVVFTVFNEIMSILENVALMGVPIPKILLKGLDVLHEKTGEDADPSNITYEKFKQLKAALEAQGLTLTNTDGNITILADGKLPEVEQKPTNTEGNVTVYAYEDYYEGNPVGEPMYEHKEDE